MAELVSALLSLGLFAVVLGAGVLVMALFVGAFVAMFATVLKYAEQQRRAHEAAVSEVARRLSLEHAPGHWTKRPSARGRLGDHEVVLDSISVRRGKSSTPYTRLRVGGRLPAALTIEPEHVLSALGRAFGAEDVEVGDAALDGAALLRGEPAAMLLARLDPATRRLVGEAVRDGLYLADGSWTWRTAGLEGDPNRLVALAERLRKLADAFAAVPDVEAALRDRVDADPDSGVRVRALHELRAQGRLDDVWLARLVDDEDARVALHAAKAAGETGRARLIALLDHDDARIARAAALAAAELPPGQGHDRLQARLIDGLASRDLAVVRALGRVGTPAAVPALRSLQGALGLSEVEREAERAIAAIQARVVGAERGGLSVASPAGGDLAIAEVARGAVSVAREPG